jgi:ethanolamine utilization protein EutN
MQLGRVIGHATSTIKHATLNGWRMVVVQPLDAAGGEDGTPIIAIDNLGSDKGSQVVLTSDGKGVREMIGSDNTPVRWAVIGIKD